MPIYEYECTKCNQKFELMRSFNDDDADIKCPKCEAGNPRKVISLFASGSGADDSCAPSPSGGG